MPKPIKDYVKKHLEKRNIPESKLTDDVIDAFNAFSEDELDVMVDKLGETLMADDKLNDHQRISAVH